MKKIVSLLCIISILSGCAHTIANPVQLAQIGDESKTCRATVNEMQEMRNAQLTAANDRNKQVSTNVVLGVTGLFLLVPWFFMDTGNAATVEEKAAQARYSRLQAIADDKKCDVKAVAVAAPLTPVAASAK